MVRIVGMMAAVLLVGCGVGADELPAVDGTASGGQALEESRGAVVSVAGVPQPTETRAPLPGKDPGTVALPQDPIPVYEGKPLPPPSRTVDPGVITPAPGVVVPVPPGPPPAAAPPSPPPSMR
jgi:hypothetical protein